VAGTSGRLGNSGRLMDRKIAISPQEAADILGVSLPTVRKLLFTGRIRFARAGRRILIPVSALEAFLNGEEVKDAASR
jgi:excisionase family DNA binding protein